VIEFLAGALLVLGSALVFFVVLEADRTPAPPSQSEAQQELPRLRRAA
jgi:hypothetical protein